MYEVTLAAAKLNMDDDTNSNNGGVGATPPPRAFGQLVSFKSIIALEITQWFFNSYNMSNKNGNIRTLGLNEV